MMLRPRVEHDVAIVDSSHQRWRLRHITDDESHILGDDIPRASGIPHQRPNLMASLGQEPHDGIADLAGGPRDQRLHAVRVLAGRKP